MHKYTNYWSLFIYICVIFANTVVCDILIQVNISCIQSVLLWMIWHQVVYHEYLNLWYKWGFFPTCFYLVKKCHFQIFYVELRDVKISRGQTICCKIQDAYLNMFTNSIENEHRKRTTSNMHLFFCIYMYTYFGLGSRKQVTCALWRS